MILRKFLDFSSPYSSGRRPWSRLLGKNSHGSPARVEPYEVFQILFRGGQSVMLHFWSLKPQRGSEDGVVRTALAGFFVPRTRVLGLDCADCVSCGREPTWTAQEADRSVSVVPFARHGPRAGISWFEDETLSRGEARRHLHPFLAVSAPAPEIPPWQPKTYALARSLRGLTSPRVAALLACPQKCQQRCLRLCHPPQTPCRCATV